MSGRSMVLQLVERHLQSGQPVAGAQIAFAPDQLFLQDTNGPMSFLQFEAMKASSLRVPRVVAYVDHNVLEVDWRNSDDHR